MGGTWDTSHMLTCVPSMWDIYDDACLEIIQVEVCMKEPQGDFPLLICFETSHAILDHRVEKQDRIDPRLWDADREQLREGIGGWSAYLSSRSVNFLKEGRHSASFWMWFLEVLWYILMNLKVIVVINVWCCQHSCNVAVLIYQMFAEINFSEGLSYVGSSFGKSLFFGSSHRWRSSVWKVTSVTNVLGIRY